MICSTTCVSCSTGVACVSVSCSQQCYCPTNYYWTNMQLGCVPQVGYGAVCSSTVQCSTSLKLVCSTTNDQCYGPTSLARNHCDCLVGQYYDSSLGCGTFFKMIKMKPIFCYLYSFIKKSPVSRWIKHVVTRTSVWSTRICSARADIVCAKMGITIMLELAVKLKIYLSKKEKLFIIYIV